MTARIRDFALAATVLALATAQPAAAYIDPGSGSALISIIVGVFVTIGLAVKSFWYKITGFFGAKIPEDNDNS